MDPDVCFYHISEGPVECPTPSLRGRGMLKWAARLVARFPIFFYGGEGYALDASKTARNASREVQDSKTTQYASNMLPNGPKMPAMPKTPQYACVARDASRTTSEMAQYGLNDGPSMARYNSNVAPRRPNMASRLSKTPQDGLNIASEAAAARRRKRPKGWIYSSSSQS